MTRSGKWRFPLSRRLGRFMHCGRSKHLPGSSTWNVHSPELWIASWYLTSLLIANPPYKSSNSVTVLLWLTAKGGSNTNSGQREQASLNKDWKIKFDTDALGSKLRLFGNRQKVHFGQAYFSVRLPKVFIMPKKTTKIIEQLWIILFCSLFRVRKRNWTFNLSGKNAGGNAPPSTVTVLCRQTEKKNKIQTNFPFPFSPQEFWICKQEPGCIRHRAHIPTRTIFWLALFPAQGPFRSRKRSFWFAQRWRLMETRVFLLHILLPEHQVSKNVKQTPWKGKNPLRRFLQSATRIKIGNSTSVMKVIRDCRIIHPSVHNVPPVACSSFSACSCLQPTFLLQCRERLPSSNRPCKSLLTTASFKPRWWRYTTLHLWVLWFARSECKFIGPDWYWVNIRWVSEHKTWLHLQGREKERERVRWNISLSCQWNGSIWWKAYLHGIPVRFVLTYISRQCPPVSGIVNWNGCVSLPWMLDRSDAKHASHL